MVLARPPAFAQLSHRAERVWDTVRKAGKISSTVERLDRRPDKSLHRVSFSAKQLGYYSAQQR
jgi:hypothetical protein